MQSGHSHTKHYYAYSFGFQNLVQSIVPQNYYYFSYSIQLSSLIKSHPSNSLGKINPKGTTDTYPCYNSIKDLRVFEVDEAVGDDAAALVPEQWQKDRGPPAHLGPHRQDALPDPTQVPQVEDVMELSW